MKTTKENIVKKALKPLQINVAAIFCFLLFVIVSFFFKDGFGDASGVFFGIITMPLLIPMIVVLTITSVFRVLRNYRYAGDHHQRKTLVLILIVNCIIFVGLSWLVADWFILPTSSL